MALWPINREKSILTPVRSVEYLGAIWNSTGVERTKVATSLVNMAIARIPNIANEREEQVIRGYLGYYLSFAGPAYSIVNKVIKIKNKKNLKFLYYLGRLNKISFYHRARIKSVIHCDATNSQGGYIIDRIPAVLTHRPIPIIMAETFVALTAMIKRAYNHKANAKTLEIDIYTDNMATLYFLRKGSCRWSIPIEIHFKILKILLYLMNYIKIRAHWIPSESNPADYYSRVPLGLNCNMGFGLEMSLM